MRNPLLSFLELPNGATPSEQGLVSNRNLITFAIYFINFGPACSIGALLEKIGAIQALMTG
jgi:hypothetical protein